MYKEARSQEEEIGVGVFGEQSCVGVRRVEEMRRCTVHSTIVATREDRMKGRSLVVYTLQ
jgi:hypothetical protein